MLSSYQLDLLSNLGINILLALSVYCPMATGQLSIGNAGFMALGAYTSAILTVHLHLPLFPALIIGGIVAGIIGLLVGFPALRLKGIFLAMATLAGGNVRVGLEDNLYLERGVFATNAQLVERAVTILENMGVRVLGPDEVRDKLHLAKRG